MRHMVIISAAAVGAFGWMGAAEYAKVDERGSVAAYVIYVVLGLGALFVVQRCLLLPSKAWVRIEGDSLAWKTHKSLVEQGVSASDSVAMRDVESVAVIVQNPTTRMLWTRRQIEMRAIRLELRGGENVVLPIRGMAVHLSAGSPFGRLLDELRRQQPELMRGVGVAA